MLRGIYTAACGMRAQEVRQALTASNLANVTTPGYKRDVGVGESFSQVITGIWKNAGWAAWDDKRDHFCLLRHV